MMIATMTCWKFRIRRSVASLQVAIVLFFIATTAASDVRRIRRHDLDADVFVDGSATSLDGPPASFSELLIDPQRNQVIVGAADSLFRLNLGSLAKLERASWPPDEDKVTLCNRKGQSEEDCRNHVRVLVLSEGGDSRVLACGTHAFSPRCSWREPERLNRVTEWLDGRARCPFSPAANATALMTATGDLYVGGPTDFSGSDSAIYRMSGRRLDERVLRSAPYNSLWFDRPDFVASFETKRFLYFLFREPALEYTNCGKAVYSRLARVCKDDRGGKLVLKNAWTTFLKARLNCSLPGEYPFYFNEIQSADYLASDDVVYATFTTGDNSIAGSAVCSFNLSSVEKTFEGPFKTRGGPDSAWKPVHGVDHSLFRCGQNSADNRETLVAKSKEYQLLDGAVQPETESPIFHQHLQTFTHIAVETVRTKTATVHVLYVAIRTGEIKKLSHDPRTRETCLIEIVEATSAASPIANLRLHKSSLYLATSEAVLKINSSNCGRLQTRRACLAARDPHCGWSRSSSGGGRCVRSPNGNPRTSSWEQASGGCPVLDEPVDGDWGPWSEWTVCDLTGQNDLSYYDKSDLNEDGCMCRRRTCDSPLPSNGGGDCVGSAVEVANCTRHGGWTQWSEWGACSNTCNLGTRRRKRICGNPAPAFGGRVCVGRDVDTQLCNDLPKCNGDDDGMIVTQWSDWSQCSTGCGRGFRKRTRECSNCCGEEYAECDGAVDHEYAASETTESTVWTPWVRSDNRSLPQGSWYEERFRFHYSSPVTVLGPEPVAEKRVCTVRGGCRSTYTVTTSVDLYRKHSWSQWSSCTRECGGGHQVRVKECDGSGCDGSMVVVERPCNTYRCAGEWACWSQWSQCESGVRRRHRECRSEHYAVGSAKCAGGASYEESGCADDSWTEWSQWTECVGDDETSRRSRKCLMDECQGEDGQSRQCSELLVSGGAGVGSVLLACALGLIFGALIGAGAVYYMLIVRRSPHGGSPHYVSAKSQNLYVSLPMLDLKHKFATSSSNDDDCSTLRSNTTAGTLRSTNSIYRHQQQPDYETATIKRSHSQRNSSLLMNAMKADLESDQPFT